MYIALTGYMGTGKGEIVKLLLAKGFKATSLSDMVRREAKLKGVPETRENLQETGNELRRNFGPGVLGKRVREFIENEELGNADKPNWIIDGIRNPLEWEELKKLGSGIEQSKTLENHVSNGNNILENPTTLRPQLLALTASFISIVDRIQKRKRIGEEKMTKEQIYEKIKKESGVGEDANGQQVQKCLEKADFLIINEGTLKDLEQKLEHFINLTLGKDRPSFDEIFMEVAYSWSKRATCLRRHVGAVIAKDKQQLTTGYNGAPRGIPHCAEVGGCLREKLGVPSGKNAELCRGTHAEQNAITQAAKFGINIEGGTLYCNTFPCVICTKMILNSGITKVVYDSDYDDPLSKEILGQQNIVEMVRYEGKKFHY